MDLFSYGPKMATFRIVGIGCWLLGTSGGVILLVQALLDGLHRTVKALLWGVFLLGTVASFFLTGMGGSSGSLEATSIGLLSLGAPAGIALPVKGFLRSE